jgi:peptide subunit release factor RF-3
MEEYQAGIQTPVFFGSALKNFGVKETLDLITHIAPTPRSREAVLAPYDSGAKRITIEPTDSEFTGFIFKIQANMDPKHRDRVAFVRLASGHFERGMKLTHVRTKKQMAVSNPVMFLAADRLAKDPMDAGARTDLIELAPHVDAKLPPYGMAHRPWAGAIGGVDVLVELINADAATGSPGDTAESDIIGAAQDLRSLLRPHV